MFKLALIIFNPSEQVAQKAVGLNSFWIDCMGLGRKLHIGIYIATGQVDGLNRPF